MTLPQEWCRGPQWASEAARQEWAPVLEAAAGAWNALETLTVAEGVRPSALVYLDADELVAATVGAAAHGFDVVPLARAGAGVRAALCRPADRVAWLAAWQRNDHEAIGGLLGFPACCTAHFRATWAAGRTDTVTTMAAVDGPPEANVMHRHLGVRLVPHLPCSATCAETVALGQRTAEAGRLAGLDVDSVYRVLRLPVAYSAVAGVAITTTPHFRFLSGTDYAACTREARRAGHNDDATGQTGPATWKDNGFGSTAAMEAAHATVAMVVNRATVTSALDLGAGDGALLARLAAGRPGTWVGVECDEGRAGRGRVRHPGVDLLHGTIESLGWSARWGAAPVDVALLMPGRLLEMPEERARSVRVALRGAACRLVVYAYGDWIKAHPRGLAGLAETALHLPAHSVSGVVGGGSVQAAEVKF